MAVDLSHVNEGVVTSMLSVFLGSDRLIKSLVLFSIVPQFVIFRQQIFLGFTMQICSQNLSGGQPQL